MSSLSSSSLSSGGEKSPAPPRRKVPKRGKARKGGEETMEEEDFEAGRREKGRESGGEDEESEGEEEKQLDEEKVFLDKTITMTMDSIIDAVVVTNDKGVIFFCNTAVENMFGYSRDFLIGENVSILMPEPFKSQHDRYLKLYEGGAKPKLLGVTRTLKGQRSNGFIFPLDISLGLFPYQTFKKGKVFVATIREVQHSSEETWSLSSGSSEEKNKADLAKLLAFHGLESYTKVFEEEEIDIRSFIMMTDENLASLGIKMGSRLKMMSIINDFKRKNQSPTLHTSTPTFSNDRIISRSLSLFSSSSSASAFSIDQDEILFQEIIGRGSFGVVYKGLWKDRKVAIKKVLSSAEQEEAKLLSKIRHRHIVQCFGVVQTASDCCLIMELGKCNLKQAIHQSDLEIDPPMVVSWATQIAKGMNYLHTEAVEIILHRDLKPGNVLLFEDGVLKISDFGLSKVREQQFTEQMSSVGTFEYMAPEVIQNIPYSEKADVYSYGVLVWEILTRQVPYQGLPPLAVAFGVGSGTLSLPLPSNCPPIIVSLLKQCLEREHSRRPSFQDIILTMEVISKSDFMNSKENELLSLQNVWKQELYEIFSDFREQHDKIHQRQVALSKAEKCLDQRERNLLEREAQFKRTYSADIHCFSSKKTFEEDILGLGITVERDPLNACEYSITQICPAYLSCSAYFEDEVRTPPASIQSKKHFTNWLPMYICPAHGSQIQSQLDAALIAIDLGIPQTRTSAVASTNEMRVRVISRCLDYITSLLFVKSDSSNDKTLDGYFALYRLFFALAEDDPTLVEYATKSINDFSSDGLGKMELTEREFLLSGLFSEQLLKLTLVDPLNWNTYAQIFMEEALQLTWVVVLLMIPKLQYSIKITKEEGATNGDFRGLKEEGFLLEAFKISHWRIKSFLLLFYLIQTLARPQNVSFSQSALFIDSTWGKAPLQLREAFDSNSDLILSLDNFEEIFQNVGYFPENLSPFDAFKQAYIRAFDRGYFSFLGKDRKCLLGSALASFNQNKRKERKEREREREKEREKEKEKEREREKERMERLLHERLRGKVQTRSSDGLIGHEKQDMSDRSGRERERERERERIERERERERERIEREREREKDRLEKEKDRLEKHKERERDRHERLEKRERSSSLARKKP